MNLGAVSLSLPSFCSNQDQKAEPILGPVHEMQPFLQAQWRLRHSLGHSSQTLSFQWRGCVYPWLHWVCPFNQDKSHWHIPNGPWKFTQLAWNGSIKTRNEIEVRDFLWRDNKRHWGILHAPAPTELLLTNSLRKGTAAPGTREETRSFKEISRDRLRP